MNASKSRAAPIIAILCLFLLCVGGLGYFLFIPEEASNVERSYTAKAPTEKSMKVGIDGAEKTKLAGFKMTKGPDGTAIIKKLPGKFNKPSGLRIEKGHSKRGMALRGFPKREIPKVPEKILKKTGLRGRLLDSSKNPVANAKVSANGAPTGSGGMVFMGDMPGMPRSAMGGGPSATTDEDGRFVLMGLNYKMGYKLRFEGGEEYKSTSKPAPSLRAEEVVNAGDFTIQRPGQISGYVLDPSGQPLPGATVRIRDSASEMPIIFGDGEEDEGGEGKDKNVAVMVAKSSETGEVTVFSSSSMGIKTDKDGRFTFEDLEPGKFTVTASKKGFRKAQVANIVVAESQHVDNVRLPLGVAGKIRVLVKNEAGEVVTGARVQAKPFTGMMFGGMFVGRKKSGVPTDNNGYAFLENLSQNKYRVVASAEGYADSFSVVEFKEGEEEANTTVTMKEGTRVIGRVVRAKDNSPVVGAIAFVRNMAKNKGRSGPPMIPTMIQTDKEGRFKSKALNPGTYQVNISAEGLQSFAKTVTVSLDRKTEDLGDVSLEDLQSLEVTVLDIEGNPLAGARVRVNQEAQGMRIRASSSGTTDEDQEEDVDISIGGMDSEKITNEQGVVVLKSISPGKLALHVTKDGQPDGFKEDVLVSPGAGLSRATVRLMKPGKIEGSVDKGDSADAARLTVYLFRKGHRWPITTAKCDADGNYVFPKVCPGSYLLRVNSMLPLSAGEKFIDLRSEETLREDLTAPAPKSQK